MHLPVCQQRMHLVRLKAAKRTTWVPPPMPMIELMAAKAWSDDMWYGLTRRMDGRCHSDGRTLFIHPLGPHHSTRGIRIPARTSNARRALRLFTQETSLCPRRTIRRHLAGARVYYLNNNFRVQAALFDAQLGIPARMRMGFGSVSLGPDQLHRANRRRQLSESRFCWHSRFPRAKCTPSDLFIHLLRTREFVRY